MKIKQKKQRLFAEKKRKTILKNEKLTLNGGYCGGLLISEIFISINRKTSFIFFLTSVSEI